MKMKILIWMTRNSRTPNMTNKTRKNGRPRKNKISSPSGNGGTLTCKPTSTSCWRIMRTRTKARTTTRKTVARTNGSLWFECRRLVESDTTVIRFSASVRSHKVALLSFDPVVLPGKWQIHISHWPSARAVLGECRPELLAVRTEPLRRGLYKKDRGPIFSQYGPEQNRSIRDLLHNF